MPVWNPLTQLAFSLLDMVERAAAYIQGKGFGSATIKQEIKLACRLLDRVPILAIDIGGNVGDYTAELRHMSPALEIHTFEPSKTNIAKLKERFKNDSGITIVPIALSSASGSANLFSDQPGSGLGSLTKRKLDHFNISFENTESIQKIRFEEYWREKLQKREIDLVKLDIEGHELDALKGFGDALEATKVVQFEFGGCNIDTRTYFQDFWYFFIERDFKLFRVTPLGAQHITTYREAAEFFSTTNYLALNLKGMSKLS